MTDAEFARSIGKAYELFASLGIERSFRQPGSLPVNQEFNTLALDTTVLYEDVYVCALRLGHFNLQLRDFSFFQFSKNGDDLRLCFYPSPFGMQEFLKIKRVTEQLDLGAIDFETYCFFLEGVSFNAQRPLIRYEYSTSQYQCGVHPASHFHIGTYGDDRWVCERILTPLAFSHLVGKLYFAADWEAVTEELETGDRMNEFDAAYFRERTNCALSAAAHFGMHERGQFYFA
ncbi:DUF2290 domain-containing protein [Comamonas thiooxydans]|jgi:hypothetical protein|uniref:DUF2290 domain-containing protein n=1 Tax=Comamonas thiooxydans TaxID=363952 RepID=A0AA42TP52_9BURK|nr:DUF2290 domain-containing protein [Comamonas thiooxydans]MDH1334562.1 DUF2290 domain-containing protein [Comamonas thiooxydans]MDH1740522.1 DUF2290 domain-containing protein [Comamonas thiooxydans]MDH1789442.1 DUF2290 domain-containing protein [Comamonas thiooxydans]